MARSPFWRIETPAIFVLAYFFAAPVPFTGAQGGGTPQGKEVSAAVKAEKREYVSGSGGYRITCPEGWARHEGDIRPIDVIFFCRADPGVNMSVTWASAGGQKELTEAAVKEMKDMFRQSYPGYSVTAEEWRELDGAKAFCLSARHQEMGAELQNKQVMLIKGDRFYTLTYTSTPAFFMKHLGEFELGVGSFRTTGEKTPAMLQSPQKKNN